MSNKLISFVNLRPTFGRWVLVFDLFYKKADVAQLYSRADGWAEWVFDNGQKSPVKDSDYTHWMEFPTLPNTISAETIEDIVHHPRHYLSSDAKCSSCQAPIECIDVARTFNFNLGNVVKYIWRAGHKGDALIDLKKASWYLNDEIQRKEKK